MSYLWPQGITLLWFAPEEFDHPERMNPSFLFMLDTLRGRCEFGLEVTSDHREDEDMARIYGPDKAQWPNSAHKRSQAVDVVPSPNTQHNRLKLIHEVTGMYLEELWPRLGLEIAPKHIHLDCDSVLTRPFLWIGKSY